MIEEDQKNIGKNIPFRFGKEFDVKLGIKDGSWTFSNSKAFWTLKITSENAYSINLVLSGLFLPVGTELYMYDEKATMVYGPLTIKQNFEDGTFLAEIIKGETIVIRILSNGKDYRNVQIGIKQVVHGYRDLFPDTSKKSSGSCQKNIVCYPDWLRHGYGVNLILVSGNELCTGCLLNNTSNTSKNRPIPYELTAFHCIDENDDDELSSSEKAAVNNWAFRFNYKSTACQYNSTANYQTTNGATFKAARINTDFGLLQLDYSVLNMFYLSFIGWDKTGNTPTNGTGIHHPSGDLMKRTFDKDNLIETAWGQNSGSGYWRAIPDTATWELGSSGSPLFDQNKRVIGQDKGGFPGCDSQDKRHWFGCLYRSWTGGGDSTNSLGYWLDPDSLGYTTTDTVVFNGMYGPGLLCESGGAYAVENLPDVTYSWETTSNLEIDGSSTGYSVNIKPHTYQGGQSTIVAHMYFTEFDETRTVTKIINSVVAAPTITGPTSVKLDNQDNWYGPTQSCSSPTSYEWYIVGFEDPFYTGGSCFQYIFYDEEWIPGFIEIYCKVYVGSYYAYSSTFQVQLVPHDPLTATISGDDPVCLDQEGRWTAFVSGGEYCENTFEWYINDEYIDTGDPHFPGLVYYFESGEWGPSYNNEIDLRVYDDSTYYDAPTFYFDIQSCSKMMGTIQVEPNPASDYIDVSIIESENPISKPTQRKNESLKKKAVLVKDESITYTLFDNFGRQVYQNKTKEKNLRIPVLNFKAGVYNLKVHSQTVLADKKIIIIR